MKNSFLNFSWPQDEKLDEARRLFYIFWTSPIISDKFILTPEQLEYFKYYIDNGSMDCIDAFRIEACYQRYKLYTNDKLEIADFSYYQELSENTFNIQTNLIYDMFEIIIHDERDLYSKVVIEELFNKLKQFHYIKHYLKDFLYIYVIGIKI